MKTKLTFLGTSASPSYPVPFCTCENCRKAFSKGGPNIRKKSSLLINDDLLTDLGPDTPSAFSLYKIDSSQIKIILQTHAHRDHFDPELLIARHPEYGTIIEEEILLVASTGTLGLINQMIKPFGYGEIFDKDLQRKLKIKIKEIEPFTDYKFGNYSVIGFPANHDRANQSLLFSIQTSNARIFYGTDTSVIDEGIWNFLKKQNLLFDILILDHTYGVGFNSSDHLGNNDFISQTEKFRNEGFLKERGQIFGTHISHEGTSLHEEFNRYALIKGYQLAYDGLELLI